MTIRATPISCLSPETTQRSRQTLLRWRPTALASWFVTLIVLSPVVTSAQDTVIVSSGKDGRSRTRIAGEVLDVTGAGVRLRLTSGRDDLVPAEKVVQIESTWNAKHRQADELAANGKLTEAIALYREAANSENRTWVTRRMMASVVQCYRDSQQIEPAVELFLNLVRKDPTTPHWDVIPLAWTRTNPNGKLQSAAQKWFNDGTLPSARLIGASWLVALGQRGPVVEALDQMTNAPDSRLAQMATAQLWRTRIVQATDEDAKRWQTQMETFPAALRAGPYFVVGQAFAQRGKHEAAALSFLKIPILYAAQRELSAEAFLAAGKELEKIPDASSAAIVYRELQTTRAASPAAEEGTERLKQLVQQGSGNEKK